jgi:hypothetical protein
MSRDAEWSLPLILTFVLVPCSELDRKTRCQNLLDASRNSPHAFFLPVYQEKNLVKATSEERHAFTAVFLSAEEAAIYLEVLQTKKHAFQANKKTPRTNSPPKNAARDSPIL